MSRSHRTTLKIAEIVFAIDAEPGRLQELDHVWQQFLCAEDPDIVIEISENPIPVSALEKQRVFRSHDMWAIFAGNHHIALALYHPYSPSEIQRLIVFDEDFRHAELFFRRTPRIKTVNPLDYPLGQICMVCVLSRNRGIMVHASGIDDHGHGYLFAGNSGQGKSTLSSLWESHGRVLNDDRVIVRYVDDSFRICPTPWHGRCANVSAPSVPLDKVFLISHGDRNTIRRTRGAEASCEVLTRSFPPLWDTNGMVFTVDLLSSMMEKVPCYEMAFVPDEAVIDLVRCAK